MDNIKLNIQKKLLQQSLFEKGEAVLLVSGESMYPTLIDGQRVVIKNKDSYDVNDIVAFYRCNGIKIILHRIISKDGDTYVTKGDFYDYNDFPITINDIIGYLVDII